MTTSSVDITDILCEFLEVAIHNILYTRKLYPEAIFVPAKKYGVVVYQSVHPLLNEYITQTLKAAQSHIKNNQLKQVLLCIKNEARLVEKYIFDILQLESKLNNRDLLMVKLEQNLRSFCLKLANSVGNFKVLSSNSEFNILLHTTEYSSVAFNEEQGNNEFPWIPVTNVELDSLGILPLHTIDTDNLILQIYIEKCDDS